MSLLWPWAWCWLLLLPSSMARDWAYHGHHGPAHWGGQCTSGLKQSPIDLRDPVYKEFKPWHFENYETQAQLVTVTNNGHTVVVRMKIEDQQGSGNCNALDCIGML